jgi:hypothetical protein
MGDDTRKLLKVFGVAVTDFEAEAAQLEAAAAQLSGDAGQLGRLLQDVTELCRELNTRWLETTQHLFAVQDRLLARCAEAAARLQKDEPARGGELP